MGDLRSIRAKRAAVNVGIAFLAPAIFLILLELVLAAAGVRPLALTEDPLVGFSSLQPLFVEKASPIGPAVMTTNPAKLAHFNAQTFPTKKPSGAYRIFTVGGSTTYGHPWRDPVSYGGWLRQLLPAADPSRTWEVVNAGGISYASYREAKLVEEITRYQPDLIIVYSGHNEFLEERTYRKTTEIPGFIRETSALLDRTRTYTVMRKALRKSRSDDAGNEGTTSMSAEVDDVLAKTIGPKTYTRDDDLRREVLRHYRLSLERMAKLAHSVGAQVLFLTTPGNERDCSPFKSESTPGLKPADIVLRNALSARADSLQAAGNPGLAFPILDSLAAIESRNAAWLYRAGKAALAAGRHADAKRLLLKALDEDICPLRALPAMRGIVLAVARETGSEALDVTAALESETRRLLGHDILGEPQFVDHVHLSIEEYRGIALGVIGKLAGMGVLHPRPEWGDAAVRAIADRVMAGMGPREQGEGLHNIAKVLNWAGKHEDAARIAAKALTVDSTGLESIWSSLFVGAALERVGRSAEAIPHYRRAVRLDTTNGMARQYLHDALERAGMGHEATAEAAILAKADPGDPSNLERLGINLLQEGRIAEALPQLAAASAAQPSRADLLVLLGEAQRRGGESAEAARSFERALALNPREGKALMGLARLAEAQGNQPEAISLYAKALSVSPDLHEARAALSRALQGMPGTP